MALYHCRVTTSDGTEDARTVEAETAAAAVEELGREGWQVSSLVGLSETLVPNAPPPTDARSFLLQSLADLVQSGLPLPQALRTVGAEVASRRLRKATERIADGVEAGRSLAETVAESRSFPPICAKMIAVGERSGKLPHLLAALADQVSLRVHARTQLIQQLIYPALVAAALVGFFLLQRQVIYPSMQAMYDDICVMPPVPTLLVMGFMEWFPLGLAIGAAALGIVLLAAWWLGRDPRWRRMGSRAFLAMPGLGAAARAGALARVTGTLGLLTGSGTPLPEAMDISADMAENAHIHQAVLAAANEVREGAPLGEALARARAFPPLLVWMVEVGRERNALPQFLREATTAYTREAALHLQSFQMFLGPALILSLAVLIGSLAYVSLFLPFVTLVQAIQ